MTKENLNYFSEKEKAKMKKFANMRTKFLTPLLAILDRLRISPNMISLVGFLSMGGFVYFANKNLYYALVFVGIHILLDGIDGSLARYQRRPSDSGALVDICVDQGGIIIATLSLIYYSLIDPFWGSLYILSYTVMITFVIIANQIKHSVKYIIRTKYIFYGILFVDTYFDTRILYPFLIVMSIYMTFASVYLFNKLRKNIT